MGGGTKTMRNIIEMNSIFGMGASKREESSNLGGTGPRANKLHEFIKSQQNTLTLKEQMKRNRNGNKGETSHNASNEISMKSN